MVSLLRITDPHHHLLDKLFQLYEETFPVEERRDHASLKNLMSNQQMYFNAIFNENNLFGLIVYWHFDNLLFVEHFAIFPNFRDQGIGSKVITLLKEKQLTLVLEVEPPNTDLQKRRIGFYLQNGIYVLDVPYFQPSYVYGGVSVPMLLMCNDLLVSQRLGEEMIRKIYREVYQFTCL
jgi:ribosomal protein S18 acetylase RimI-like enzyme